MIEEALFDDLDVLDYLELLNSTVRASEALGMSQSSCSRRYRALSSNLDVEFDRVDGAYMGSPEKVNSESASTKRRPA